VYNIHYAIAAIQILLRRDNVVACLVSPPPTRSLLAIRRTRTSSPPAISRIIIIIYVYVYKTTTTDPFLAVSEATIDRPTDRSTDRRRWPPTNVHRLVLFVVSCLSRAERRTCETGTITLKYVYGTCISFVLFSQSNLSVFLLQQHRIPVYYYFIIPPLPHRS